MPAIPADRDKALSMTILDTLVVTTTTLSNGVVSAAYSATLAAGGGLCVHLVDYQRIPARGPDA